MANPLSRGAEKVTPRFNTMQERVDWMNETCRKKDVIWIIGQNNAPLLVDNEPVLAIRSAETKQRMEIERQRFNWRRLHPMSEGEK